ncbi:mechanosensitive ion channel family protein [Gemmatimonadota bacterium]
MDTLLQWINGPGPIRWVVDVLVLPLAAAFLAFGLRALYLRFRLTGDKSEAFRQVRRQSSKIVAFLLTIAAIMLIWRARLEGLVTQTGTSSAQRVILEDWVRGLAWTAVTTLVLVFILIAIKRTYVWGIRRMDAWTEAHAGVRVQGAVLVTPAQVRNASVLGMKFGRFALTIALLYVYVPLVLSWLPPTRPLAGRVMPVVVGPVVGLGLAFLQYVPRLASLVLIILAVRYFLRFLDLLMAAVGQGRITVSGFDPEWADQTARLLRIVVILATLMIVYPFLPGAGSEVFRGFSLFAGALFTLGASSSVSNVIAGIILTYTRSFRVGDRIRIGETTGDVVTRGLFVIRLRTVYNELITVSNGVAVGGRVVNYTAGVTERGSIALSVTAGIGYDVDWRQVHELMKSAAAQTENIVQEPEPIVLQTALADFAVNYELRAWTAEPSIMRRTESTLRQNVLDQFAEAGVEIMTPNVNAVRNSVEPAIPGSYVPDATSPALRFLGLQGA